VLAWGGYIVWSFVQQFLLQGYFLFRLLRLVPRTSAALTAAGIFAAAHLPNPVLTAVTLLWGSVACFVFLRCRNVYILMLTHAVLGVTLAISVPGPILHNMRVGLGYLRYREPGRGKPVAINPQTGRVI
jgi:membrane protease YdiL (CAAX protease family)